MALNLSTQSGGVGTQSDATMPPFCVLYRAEFPFVYNVLRRFGVAPRDLEDLSHDVFLVAYRNGSYDPTRPLRPWLYGIAFRVASDFQRRAQHNREQPEDDLTNERADDTHGPHEAAEASEARRLVLRALKKVEPERRAVLVLHELEEISVPQVARALDIPEGTAWSRLRQGRIDLAQALREIQSGGQT
jgi:RNA polymerase sigma-70 factor, ECF subfamily